MPMPILLDDPTVVPAAGNLPKVIREFAGRASTGDGGVSVAMMKSPQGWVEPGQRPEFTEITLVLGGALVVEFEGGSFEVRAGQAVLARPGEWVRYATPGPEGAEYVAICLPAFTPDTVHRDPP
jgi:mannose-6-phosphate isomerase-like protein (cupin superfamily)